MRIHGEMVRTKEVGSSGNACDLYLGVLGVYLGIHTVQTGMFRHFSQFLQADVRMVL
jgi:hypothetical protein